MSQNKRRFTVLEVVSILEDDRPTSFEDARIYIDPGVVMVILMKIVVRKTEGDNSNLNPHQLTVPATATIFRNGVRQILDADEERPVDSEAAEADPQVADCEDSPTPSTSSGPTLPCQQQPAKGGKRKKPASTSTSSKKTKSASEREWRRIDLSKRQKERFTQENEAVDLTRLPTTPTGLFEVFFDEDVIKLIVQMPGKYGRAKGNNTFSTSLSEVKVFLAILLVSGYNQVPRRRMYWTSDTDVHNEVISSAMTRNCFDEMMRYLHLSDNDNLDPGDK